MLRMDVFILLTLSITASETYPKDNLTYILEFNRRFYLLLLPSNIALNINCS